MNDFNSTSKCSAKAVWLSLYFILHVFGFTCLLLAVVSPSWQYVYLEEGRTEHHHGLWMDCKRDYSNEYGRPREYYEKLFRLDHMQGPFDQFSLPSLQCVYKFDYWLDDEDWYEHGYDENRLQDDAYQHLWLGWKIAALTALLLSLIFTLSALITCVCGFCHRLLVCVSAVLSTIGVLTCIIGNTIFYMYARYQDNNIIKQDEGIYEQYFGWSFYTSLIANGFLFFAAVVGCISTSIVVSSGKAKLVKIEVEDNDSIQLLSSGSSSQPFKRSYSAVYKIDSVALRKWEKEAMKGFKKNNFKRANSMPNIKKGQHRPLQTPSYTHSNSDISKAFTDPAHFISGPMQRESLALSETHLADHYTGILPTGGSAFPAHASDPVYPPPLPPNNPDDVVYEYVEHNSISLSSTLGKNQHSSPNKESTSLNYYDKVASSSPSISSHQKIHTIEDNEYLRPKNTKSTTIPAYSEPSKERYLYERNLYEKSTNDKTTTSFGTKHRRNPSEDFSRHPELLQNNTKSTLITPISSFPSKQKPPELPAKPSFLKSADNQSIASKASSRESDKILLNTFDDKRSLSNNRSLTSLHSVIPEKPINVFDRSETCTPTSPASSHDSYASTSTPSRPLPSKLLHTVLRNEAANNSGIKETSLDWPKLPSSRNSRDGSIVSNNSFNGSLRGGGGSSYAPSEMDRSVGASTIIAPNSPSQKFFEFDSDSERSMTPKAGPNGGETFV